MANAAQNASKLQIGKLSPEEAERLASSFRPVWELDDAPFVQANGLSAADVDALSAGAGVAPSVRGNEAQHGTFELKTQVSPPPRVPAPNEPKVEIAVDVEPDPPPPAPVVAQARPQPAPAPQVPTVARKPYTPPRPPPTPVKMSRDPGASDEFVPVKKSSTGIVLAVIGVLAVGGAIFGIRAAMSNKTQAATTSTATTSTPTQEATHIPPPPDTALAAPTQEATQAATQAPAPPPHEVATSEPTHAAPAPTHVAHTAATHTATTVAHTTHHSSGGGGHTAIVRDNPF